MRNNFHPLQVAVIIIVFIQSGSCSVSAETQEQPIPTNVSTTSEIPIRISTPTEIQTTKVVTSTLSVLPAPSPAPITPTPQTTLSVEDARTFLYYLLEDNGNCELPCLWGITPREMDDSINGFLEKFGDFDIPNTYYSERVSHEHSGGMIFVLWENMLKSYLYFSFYEDEEGIGTLGLYSEAQIEVMENEELKTLASFENPYYQRIMNYYLLPTILTKYGVPSQILIYPFQDQPNRPDATILLSIVLVYERRGFSIEYLMPKETDGLSYLGCPQKTGYLSVLSWYPIPAISFEQIAIKAGGGLGLNQLNWEAFKPLQDVTTSTLDEFTQTFKDSDNEVCLETPVDIWPGP